MRASHALITNVDRVEKFEQIQFEGMSSTLSIRIWARANELKLNYLNANGAFILSGGRCVVLFKKLRQ